MCITKHRRGRSDPLLLWQALLTEMGMELNPKALMVCVGVISDSDFQGCSPVRMPEWLVRYKDVIKQD